MLVHFSLAIFITLGFIIFPVGYKLGCTWIQNWSLRLFHLLIMGVITAETVVGLTCPLTAWELSLRSIDHSGSFVAYWIERILFSNLSQQLFILLYSLCFLWVVFLWKRCPPIKRKRKLEVSYFKQLHPLPKSPLIDAPKNWHKSPFSSTACDATPPQ